MNLNGPDLVNSIPSRSLDVWQRLYTRYSLEPGPASVAPDVLKTIVPVTQADLLLARHRGVTDTTVVTGVQLDLVVHTVPEGIRRTFLVMRATRTSGTWTIDMVSLRDVSEGVTVSLMPQSASDNVFVPAWSAPIVAEQGDEVTVDVASESVNGDLVFEAWVIDEDLF